MKAAFSAAATSTFCAASGVYSAMDENPQTPFLYTLAETPEMSEREFWITFPESRPTRRLRFSWPRSSGCVPVPNNDF